MAVGVTASASGGMTVSVGSAVSVGAAVNVGSREKFWQPESNHATRNPKISFLMGLGWLWALALPDRWYEFVVVTY